MAIHKFQGQSGSWYVLEMIRADQTFVSTGGVYMFARYRADRNYDVLYVGKAENLATRPTRCHEKYSPALARGMTHIGAMACSTDFERDKIERDLIGGWQPPLNEKLRNPFLKAG